MSEPTSRERILEAAHAVVMEMGARHLSLDAVAARAGLSKGGLLYNFPNKAALLKALVAHHVEGFEKSLSERMAAAADAPSPTIAAFLDLCSAEMKEACAPQPGILAAIAEDPDMLDPVREHSRALLDRIAAESDPAGALVAYLAMEGLRATRLFGTDMLTAEEKAAAMTRLRAMLKA